MFNLSPNLKKIAVVVLTGIFVDLCILLSVPCFLSCVIRSVLPSFAQVLLFQVEDKKRRIVGKRTSVQPGKLRAAAQQQTSEITLECSAVLFACPGLGCYQQE